MLLTQRGTVTHSARVDERDTHTAMSSCGLRLELDQHRVDAFNICISCQVQMRGKQRGTTQNVEDRRRMFGWQNEKQGQNLISNENSSCVVKYANRLLHVFLLLSLSGRKSQSPSTIIPLTDLYPSFLSRRGVAFHEEPIHRVSVTLAQSRPRRDRLSDKICRRLSLPTCRLTDR